MQKVLRFFCLPFQIILFHPNHITVTDMKILIPLQLIDLAGKILIFHPCNLRLNRLHLRNCRLITLLRTVMKHIQLFQETGNTVFLPALLFICVLIFFRPLPDSSCFLLKHTDRIPALDLRLVILILPRIFFQNGLKFLHPVLFFVQLTFHCFQKPFFHKSFFIPTVSEQFRKSGLFQIHFFDNGFPFLVVNLIFRQLVKILSGLCRVVHIIIKELHLTILLIYLKQLSAGRKILEDHFFFSFFHHRKMMDILHT